MKKLVYVLISCAIAVCSHSCVKVDSYPEPDATLTGTIIDINTGRPIETEQGNGIRIRMDELSWGEGVVPMFFWVRQNGTYQNKKVFKGTYRVTPVDGPYFPIEGKEVDIDGTAVVDFEVEPFLNVEITNIEQNGGNLAVSFRLSRSRAAFKITDARVFMSNISFVGNSTFLQNPNNTLSPQANFVSIPDETVLAETHTLNVTGLPGGGREFFLRVGARTDDNVQKRYNYSEVIKITVP